MLHRRLIHLLLLSSFLTGCGGITKVVVNTHPVPQDINESLRGNEKINLQIVRVPQNIVQVSPGVTSLDLAYNTKQRKTAMYVADGDIFTPVAQSFKNAVTGAGYELSDTGEPVKVHVVAIYSGLYLNSPPINPAASFIGGALFSASTGQLSFLGASGGNACSGLFVVVETKGKGTPFTVHHCDKFGFETTATYTKTMDTAITTGQKALLTVLRGPTGPRLSQ